MIEFTQIGWFDPGTKRFCYTDEKEFRADLHSSYTHPVFSIDPETANKLSVQITAYTRLVNALICPVCLNEKRIPDTNNGGTKPCPHCCA